MGDYADDLIDAMMCSEEWDEPPASRDNVTCQRCGRGKLHFQQVCEGWALFNSRNQRHICNTAASIDEFEDLTK